MWDLSCYLDVTCLAVYQLGNTTLMHALGHEAESSKYVAAGRGDPFHFSNHPQRCNYSIHFGSVSLYLYSSNVNLMMNLSGSACLAGYLKGS